VSVLDLISDDGCDCLAVGMVTLVVVAGGSDTVVGLGSGC